MQDMSGACTVDERVRLRHVLLLTFAGAYLNSVAYGFSYGTSNHQFELPLVNWLRNPGLYPQDPIRDAFARFPTIFWPGVAYLSRWLDSEKIVFLSFVLTKLLFFSALARIVHTRVKDSRLSACIIGSVALSPFLNDQTPLGASTVLDSVQTHTTLAVGLLLWVVCWLLEERWIPAAVLCGMTVYLDALYFVFMLFAFAAFLLFDWGRHRAAILIAGLLGAIISLPWLFLFRGVTYTQYPKGYVEALLAFFPFHLNLRSHETYDIVSSVGLVLTAAIMCLIAGKSLHSRDIRFEVLTASFTLPVFLGAVIGEFHLTPTLARLQLLRADSFLLLYSILLAQIYAANLIRSPAKGPATRLFLGAAAILLPLTESVGLLWLIFIGMVLSVDPDEHFERFLRWISTPLLLRTIFSGLLLAGITVASLKQHEEWSSTVVAALAILLASLLISGYRSAALAARPDRVAALVSGFVFLLLILGHVPIIPRLWNPVIASTALESDWRAVQDWARENTPQDAMFLVPTYPGGFRAFSERSSWGEWKDGQGMYLYPPFEVEYRSRMMAVGYSWGHWNGTEAITETYKRLSWERLSSIARQNHLSYIVQFHGVAYPARPIFANQEYSVYKVAY